jgi:hypothetical protein
MLARQIIVGFGIAAIFPALIYFGLSTFYPPPKLESYYSSTTPPPSTATPEERKAYADEQAKKRASFAADARSFARVMFSVSTVLGVIAIVLSAFLRPHAIGAGLILGGICSLALGYWAYAYYLDDAFRFASLLAGFIALLFIGSRKLRPA